MNIPSLVSSDFIFLAFSRVSTDSELGATYLLTLALNVVEDNNERTRENGNPHTMNLIVMLKHTKPARINSSSRIDYFSC